MDTIKINTFQEDILKKPKTQVLLIAKFKDEEGNKSLFNKIDQLLSKRLSKRAKEVGFNGGESEQFILFSGLEKMGYEAVMVFGLGPEKDFGPAVFLKSLASALRKVASEKLKSASFQIDSSSVGNKISPFEIGKLLSEALYLSQYHFLKYKSKEAKDKITIVNELNVCLESNVKGQMSNVQSGLEFGRLVSEGVYLARDLVNDPAEHVGPESLAAEAIKIAKDSKGSVSVKVLEEAECRKLGMGAYLGVAKGSHRKPKFIVISYNDKSRSVVGNAAGIGDVKRQTIDDTGRANDKRQNKSQRICLIGKSITFDSGGLSLKPSKGMETMKIDMAGGATVLGVFQILSQNKIQVSAEVFGILPACENMPGGAAMRPGDVVTALNGKTIEVLNTDAEGRLALADAISYAEKYLRPDVIVDLATLTGAIMVGLGPDITGLFGNDDKLIDQIKKSAEEATEPIWPMPLYKDYLEKMKSDIADLKNITGGFGGGAITAALFLEEFVGRAKWIHLDIAGSSFNEGKMHDITPKGATGWGVRTLVNWLVG